MARVDGGERRHDRDEHGHHVRRNEQTEIRRTLGTHQHGQEQARQRAEVGDPRARGGAQPVRGPQQAEADDADQGRRADVGDDVPEPAAEEG